MIEIVVCDNENNSLKSTCKKIKQIERDTFISLKIAVATQKPKEVIEYIKEPIDKTDVRLYLLEIDLKNDINGIELAKRIRQKDALSYIVFLTSHIEFAMDIYKNNLKVMDYISKPVQYEELKKCILNIHSDYKLLMKLLSYDLSTISLKSEYKLLTLDVIDIIMIEAMSPRIIIHSKNFITRSYISLKSIQNRLKNNLDFVKVHKSFIVNMNFVKSIDFGKSILTLKNNTIVPISRSEKAEVKALWKMYQKKGEIKYGSSTYGNDG